MFVRLGDIYLIITKVLHTYRQTDRPSDEAGPRGAFAPKNLSLLGIHAHTGKMLI